MRETMVLWWRFGKEHGEGGGLRLNSPDLVSAVLNRKAAYFRALPPERWRWVEVDESLIVERPEAGQGYYGPDTRIYYLREAGLAVVENVHMPPPWEGVVWFIHLAHLFYDESRDCWLSKDLFVDLLVGAEPRQHVVDGLDDLAEAMDLGLISPREASAVLRRTDELVQSLVSGTFPLPEIERARAACAALGW